MPNILRRRGVPKKKEYLLYDNFTVARAAGAVNSTPADVAARIRPIADMTRTVVDTYATTEMVLNPGFETAGGGGADVFANWTETAGDGAIADETTIKHAGSHSAKLTSGATSNTLLTQAITVIPGFTYNLSFWSYGDGTNAGQYLVYDATNAVNLIALTTTGKTAAAWAQVTASFVAPVGCVSVQLKLYCPPVNAGLCYFDDVSLLPTTGLVSIGQTDPYFITELITNGGFEKAGAGGADIWSGWVESAGNGALEKETSIVHTGGSAAKITAGASANTTIQNPLTGIIPGQQYTLTFWTRGDGTNDGRYQVYDFSNSATIVQGSTGVTGTTYTQVTVNFTAPTGCVIVQIWFKSPLANGGIAYFDDVSVKPVQSSSKLWFAGGMSVAAQGQPALYFPAITRKAGQVVKTTINQPSATELFFGLDADTTGSAVNEALDFNATNLSALSNTTSTVVVGTYSYGKDYQVAMVCRATGMFFFIKGGAFTNWTLLRVSNVGNTATLYPYFVGKNSALVADDIIIPATLFSVRALASDSFTRADAAIGSTDGLATPEGGGAGLAWSGSTATISSNKAVITPTLGAELATGTLTVGTWYSITATETNHFYTGSAVGDTFLAAATTALDANNKVKALSNIGASVLTNTPNVIVRGKVNACTTSTQAGLRVRLDSETTPANFIVCTFNGTQVIVRECVAGVYATLGTYTKAFTADDTVIVDANSATLRIYHLTAAGVESLLSSSPPTTNVTTGHNHGIFSTLAANKFSSFECFAKGAEGQYAGLDTL